MGFFGRILCVMKKEGKEVTDFPHTRFQVASGWECWAKPHRGFGEARLWTFCLERQDTRETNSSTKCQVRNIRSAVVWQRTVVTREGFLEEVGLN